MAARVHTFCRICEAACGLVARRGPDGQLIGLQPDREHPVSRGYACAKGTRFLEVARHPSRLLRPEVDGAVVEWPEAIATTAARLRAIVDRHGPHAVGIYFGNPMAFNALGVTATLMFARALGTRNVFYAGSQDCNNKFAGSRIVHGSEVVHPTPDFERTAFALVLGSNPYVSQSSFVHLEGGSARVFDGILARGGSIVWVDPRRSESAARWGEHLPIVPGTDAWLLLGLLQLLGHRAPARAEVTGLHELLDAARSIDLQEIAARTGIDTPAIERLARRIADAESTALHMSVGVNQGGHGTLAYVCLQALAFVTGNFDREGGLLWSPLGDRLAQLFRLTGLDRGAPSRVGGLHPTLAALPGGILADEILTPGADRIRALVVIAGDPVRSIPGADRLREAMPRLSFVAGIDMFRNATTEHADVMLPAASWLERWDVAVPSLPFTASGLVQIAGPLERPYGDTRTDARILSELALALRLPGRARWRIGALDLDRRLPAPRHGIRGPRPKPGRFLAGHRVRFWNADVHAAVERLRASPPPGDGFRLIGRRRRLGHNSWLHGGVRDGNPEPVAWMRAEDMRELGVDDGNTIEIEGPAGSLRIVVRAHEGLAARTIVVPHGLPELNVNALIPAGREHVEPCSGMLTLTGVPARVHPVAR
jgi:formate dehydrogenase